MAEWVHCNKCSVMPNDQVKVNFYLAECGHLFCQRCSEKTKAVEKCILCGKKAKLMLLNKDTNQSVLEFFTPVDNIIKKSLDVYKFQMQHWKTLHQNMSQKYNYAKKAYINCLNSNKQLLKENRMLRSMPNNAGKSNPDRRFHTSTPFSNSSERNLTFQNTSMMSSFNNLTPSKNHSMKMYPGYPMRSQQQVFNSGSSGFASLQRVPMGPPPSIHKIGTMRPFDELRRPSGK